MRDQGRFEIILSETRFYACQVGTIPLLAFIKNRVPYGSCVRPLNARLHRYGIIQTWLTPPPG